MRDPQLWTVDAHCHWSDARVFANAANELPRLIVDGVGGFQLGGVDPDEWERQTKLREQFPARVWRAFGLHPYFVATHARAALEVGWAKLERQASEPEMIGEIGLDFRKKYLEAGPQVQLEFFRRQLELAQTHKKPVILHIVRAHEEALREVSDFKVQAMVHAFTGNWQIAERYLKFGFSLSIGAQLLNVETQDLAETVRQMPLTQLLIESDCPDQPPPGVQSHDSATVWTIARRVAELKNLPLKQVVEQTRQNLLTLIKKECPPC